MTGKRAKPASPECSGGLRTPEASGAPLFGFHRTQQIAIIHADSWSSREYRITLRRFQRQEEAL